MKSPNRVDTHIGVRLRSLRAAKGLSQDDLAAAVGTTARQLQEWESGTKRVGSMNLRRSADCSEWTPSSSLRERSRCRRMTLSGRTRRCRQNLYPLSIDALRLVRAFSTIKNHELRQVVIKFVETAAGVGRDDEASGIETAAVKIAP